MTISTHREPPQHAPAPGLPGGHASGPHTPAAHPAGGGMIADAAPDRAGTARARPPRRRRPRLRGLSTLVVIEILLAAGLVIWAVTGQRYGWVALAVAALATLMVLPLAGGRSVLGRWARRAQFAAARSRRRSVDLTPPPFDIPASAQAAGRTRDGRDAADSEHGLIGARWAGGTLITVLRVQPAAPALTYLTPHGARLGDPTGQLVPLTALAECINPFDIPLTAIDVVSHGIRSWGDGPAAASYRRTLGPLPAAAHRSVLVILRLDPQNCADAVARRGGGAVGALRTATITTRRVARRLAESGLRVGTLSASEITMLPGQLTDGGTLDAFAEDWTSVTGGPLRLRSAAIDPEKFDTVLTDVWADPTLSTTVTVRLGHDADDRLEVRGIVRFDDLGTPRGDDGAGRDDGLIPLDGHQFDALTASLPVATPARAFRDVPAVTGSDADTLLDRVAIPAAGCGQLIGADGSGRAVAIRLVGPDVPLVAIAGEYHLAAQVVLRAVAVGASVTVHTDAPGRWHAMIVAVGDPRLLALAGDRAAAGAGPRVDVYDGVPARATEPNGTRIVVIRPGDPRERELCAGAAVVLRQNPRSPQDISVTTGSERTRVTLVATPDEWSLTGARPGPVPAQPTAGTRAR